MRHLGLREAQEALGNALLKKVLFYEMKDGYARKLSVVIDMKKDKLYHEVRVRSYSDKVMRKDARFAFDELVDAVAKYNELF